MNLLKKIFNRILSFVFVFISLFSFNTNLLVVKAASNIDITTTTVHDDLKSMNEDKLSNLSYDEFIFIAMAQYYDKDDSADIF